MPVVVGIFQPRNNLLFRPNHFRKLFLCEAGFLACIIDHLRHTNIKLLLSDPLAQFGRVAHALNEDFGRVRDLLFLFSH